MPERPRIRPVPGPEEPSRVDTPPDDQGGDDCAALCAEILDLEGALGDAMDAAMRERFAARLRELCRRARALGCPPCTTV